MGSGGGELKRYSSRRSVTRRSGCGARGDRWAVAWEPKHHGRVKELRQSISVAHEVSSEIKQRERAAELRRGRERGEGEDDTWAPAKGKF